MGEAQADSVVEAIRAGSGTAIAVKADVAVEAEVEELFAEVDARLGTVSALVNNAGIDRQVAVADVTGEQLERVFAVNAFGPSYCAREAVRRMSTARGGKGGVIVNVSSIAAVYGGMPGDALYAGSKGAVDALTLALAREVAQEGIRVSGVRPASPRPRCGTTQRCRSTRCDGSRGPWCRWDASGRPRRSPTPCCGCVRTRLRT